MLKNMIHSDYAETVQGNVTTSDSGFATISGNCTNELIDKSSSAIKQLDSPQRLENSLHHMTPGDRFVQLPPLAKDADPPRLLETNIDLYLTRSREAKYKMDRVLTSSKPVVVLRKLSPEDIARPIYHSSTNEESEPGKQRRLSNGRRGRRLPCEDDDEPLPARVQGQKTCKRPLDGEQNSTSSGESKKARNTPENVDHRPNGWNESNSMSGNHVFNREKKITGFQSTSNFEIAKEQFFNRTVKMGIDGIWDNEQEQTFQDMVRSIVDSTNSSVYCSTGENDGENSSEDALIPLTQLHELYERTAELETKEILNYARTQPIYFNNLLKILEKNIANGSSSLPVLNLNDAQAQEHEARLWFEIAWERYSRSAYSSLTALHIMTCQRFSKALVGEGIIEKILNFGKLQLQSVVFTTRDLPYRHGVGSAEKSVSDVTPRDDAPIEKLRGQLRELIHLLIKLFGMETFNDTIALQVATIGVSSFFVEGAKEVQLEALQLVTLVFARYGKHRMTILRYIIESACKLPTQKRNIRSYSLISGGNIQAITALGLQLIQSMVRLPEPKTRNEYITASYEDAWETASKFVYFLHKKCESESEEMCFKCLFGNFVEDLLITLDKPEWPASEFLLNVLCRIFTYNIHNEKTDTALKASSLDHLSCIATRMRKDLVELENREKAVDDLLSRFQRNETLHAQISFPETNVESRKHQVHKIKVLHKVLVNYLESNGISPECASKFHAMQSYRDAVSHMQFLCQQEGQLDQQQLDEKNSSEELSVFLRSLLEGSKSAEFSLEGTDDLIDYRSAEIISAYLAVQRKRSSDSDRCIFCILQAMEKADCATIRAKAIKGLIALTEVDPSIMENAFVQVAVENRIIDEYSSVRAATIDLVGRFVLANPEYIGQYYHMLTNRTLDVGVIVRKRAIKYLSWICTKIPYYMDIPEVYIKMMRRVNDEDVSVRKLVLDSFQGLWFGYKIDPDRIYMKVKTIISVVDSCGDVDLELFKKLITHLVGNKPDECLIVKTCKQIVNFIIRNMMNLGSNSSRRSFSISSCLKTVLLFGAARPQLVVPYAETIQSYLNTESDVAVLIPVIRILETILAFVNNKSFFAAVEDAFIKLINKHHSILVRQSCISCLSSVICKTTQNYSLVRGTFENIFLILSNLSESNEQIQTHQIAGLRRTLRTVGLFCKYFDFSDLSNRDPPVSLKSEIVETIIDFTCHEDDRVRVAAVEALGYVIIRDCSLITRAEIKALYNYVLISPVVSPAIICQVLKNIVLYLLEEEAAMIRNEKMWRELSKLENLKEMDDANSSRASSVIQNSLQQILRLVFHEDVSVRIAVLQVINLVLNQGLVVPALVVPRVICLSSDDDSSIQQVASHLVQEIETKYPLLLQSSAVLGVRLSFTLQTVIQKETTPVRGFRDTGSSYTSRNQCLYNALKVQQERRKFLLELLKLFLDSSDASLLELLYVADNIVHFPYTTQDEPLFIIHHIDKMAATYGISILRSYRKALFLRLHLAENFLSDDDSNCSLGKQCNDDTSRSWQDCLSASLRVTLLLLAKEALKEIFSFTDDKIVREFNTNGAKLDRTLKSSEQSRFEPQHVIAFIENRKLQANFDHNDDARARLVQHFLIFKELVYNHLPREQSSANDKTMASEDNAMS